MAMTPTAIASTAEPISSSTNRMFDPASEMMPRIATTLSTRSTRSRPGTTDVPNAWATSPRSTPDESGHDKHGKRAQSAFKHGISNVSAISQTDQHQRGGGECRDGADVVPRRPGGEVRVPFTGGVGGRQPDRIDTIEVVVQRNVERDMTNT